MRTENQIKCQIDELNEAISRLEEEKIKLLALTLVQRTAIHIHDLMCRANHTDGCSWGYEINNRVHQWEEHTHKIYLKKAILVSKQNIDLEQFIKVLTLIIY